MSIGFLVSDLGKIQYVFPMSGKVKKLLLTAGLVLVGVFFAGRFAFEMDAEQGVGIEVTAPVVVNQSSIVSNAVVNNPVIAAALTLIEPVAQSPMQSDIEVLKSLVDFKDDAARTNPPNTGGREIEFSFNGQGYVSNILLERGRVIRFDDFSSDVPDELARHFLETFSHVLGIDEDCSFVSDSRPYEQTDTYPCTVRYQQHYKGVSVFGASILMKLDAPDSVRFVASDIECELAGLDVVPMLGKDEAKEGVLSEFSNAGAVSAPLLYVYSPEVVGNRGELKLAWVIDSIDKRHFIDTETSGSIFSYPLSSGVIQKIYSGAIVNRYNTGVHDLIINGTLERTSEGSAQSSNNEINEVFEIFEKCTEFYDTKYQWGYSSRFEQTDIYYGIKNSDGVCRPTAFTFTTSGDTYEFYCIHPDYFSDDIIAHEVTHHVTSLTSKLIPNVNESGAINESLSDIFGEYFDQNMHTNEPPDWTIGEDCNYGVIRNIKSPEEDGHASIYKGTYWYPEGQKIHAYCGVGDKLFYLLSIGTNPDNKMNDPGFNYFGVNPLGIDKAIQLFWKVQASYLSQASDYSDLGVDLVGAASEMSDFSDDDIFNVRKACAAVKILSLDELVDRIEIVGPDAVWGGDVVDYSVDLIYHDGSTNSAPAGTIVWEVTSGASYVTCAGNCFEFHNVQKDQVITLKATYAGTVADSQTVNVNHGYSGGIGTADDPYIVANTNDILSLSANPSDWDKQFEMGANVDFSGCESFDRALIGWSLSTSFSGTFDGKGHRITNLAIDRPNIDAYCALFGQVATNGVVKNLFVLNADITVTDSRNGYGAILCAYNRGEISRCVVSGTVRGVGLSGSALRIGGVCGKNYGLISECKADVEIVNEGLLGTYAAAGGICGYGGGTLKRCFSTGLFEGAGRVGGICGSIYDGTIDDCHASGTVNGAKYVGGICGYGDGNHSYITDCSSTARVEATDSGAGGLVGGFNTGLRGSFVNRCYAEGDVTSGGSAGGLVGEIGGDSEVLNSYAKGDVSGGDSVGGLCGYVSYWDGGIFSNCYATGRVEGDYAVGGLLGGHHSDAGVVTACFSDSDVIGNDRVGGICGTTYRSRFDNCFSAGDVSGSSSVGGVCGELYKARMNNCHASCALSGQSLVGGVVGEFSQSTISSSFWDINQTGIANSYDSQTNLVTTFGVGLPHEEMDSQGWFETAGWDFSNVWEMGVDYPELRNMPQLSTTVDAVSISGASEIVEGQSINLSLLGDGVPSEGLVEWTVDDDRVSIHNGQLSSSLVSEDIVVTVTATYGGQTTTLDITIWNDASAALHTVIFDAGDYGQIVSGVVTQMVQFAGSANPPSISTDPHWVFAGWNRGTEYITGDTRIAALYDPEKISVVFDAGEHGSIASAYTNQVVEYGDSLNFPTVSVDADWVFLGWDHSLNGFTNDCTVSAIYRPLSRGSGSSVSPFQIETIEELEQINLNPASYYVLINDLDFSGRTNETAIIAPDSNGLNDSVYDGTPFTGTFEGNGYKISGLTIDGDRNDYLGLFGKIGQYAVIKNLTLENVSISGDQYVGGLHGYNYYGTFDHCTVSGAVTGRHYLGGICGYHERGVFIDCHAEVDVTSFGSGWGAELGYAGGFSGLNQYGSVRESSASGDVLGESYVGGFYGYTTSATILDCYATGNAYGDQAVGGLCGYSYSQIKRCYSSGEVLGGIDVGGLCGIVQPPSTYSPYRTYDSFWDTNSTTQVTSASGFGKSTEEMHQQSTFENWDFVSLSNETAVWAMDGYPVFAWQVTNSFQAWANSQMIPSDQRSYYDTPNNDGIANIWKYAMGLSGQTACSPHDLFMGKIESSSNEPPRFVMTYEKSKSAWNVQLTPMWATSLTNQWISTGIQTNMVSESAEQETWEASIPVDSTNGFMRLRLRVD